MATIVSEELSVPERNRITNHILPDFVFIKGIKDVLLMLGQPPYRRALGFFFISRYLVDGTLLLTSMTIDLDVIATLSLSDLGFFRPGGELEYERKLRDRTEAIGYSYSDRDGSIITLTNTISPFVQNVLVIDGGDLRILDRFSIRPDRGI